MQPDSGRSPHSLPGQHCNDNVLQSSLPAPPGSRSRSVAIQAHVFHGLCVTFAFPRVRGIRKQTADKQNHKHVLLGKETSSQSRTAASLPSTAPKWAIGDSLSKHRVSPHLGTFRGSWGLFCRAAEEPSCAFCRSVCPTVSLLLAENREDSGGAQSSWKVHSRAQGKLKHPRRSQPPHSRLEEETWLQHLLACPTCRPVPQRQAHHVAAQPVSKAVDPLVVEPVPCCLLQLPAGQRGSEKPFPLAAHGTASQSRGAWTEVAKQRLCPGQTMG